MSKELFDKFYKRESLVKAALGGAAIGFAVDFLFALVTVFFVGLFHFWYVVALAVGLAVGALSGVILYFTAFRPATAAMARRVDKELKLDERLITMVELQKDESYIAMRQREDAKAKIESISPKELKISVAKAFIAVVVIMSVLGLSMTTVNAAFCLNAVKLEAMIANLTQTYDEQEEKIKEIEATVKQKEKIIAGLQDSLCGVLEDEWSFVMSDLETAYNEGKITREDLMHIAHQVNVCVDGKVYEGELDGITQWSSEVESKCTLLDYTPSEEKSVEYTEGMEKGLKQAFLKSDYVAANYPNLSKDEVKIENYFGVFNGYVITGVNHSTDSINPDTTYCVSIGNIVFVYSSEYCFPYCFSLN